MNGWSSRLAFYFATVGAAVGLGSIWRFPFLAGANGGFAFIFVFVIACLAIAVPLLVAEFVIGRWARRNAPEAAGEVAVQVGGSRGWNVIGWMGAIACYIVLTYYPMIAGWVLAYTWAFGSGAFVGATQAEVGAHFAQFLSDPVALAAWHLLFLCIAAGICALGLTRGVEKVARYRSPALLVILLALVAYALMNGDTARGLAFAFSPDFSKLTPAVVLSAIGQAFYATGVGIAMMIAYGAYSDREAALVRTALVITGSVLVVSLLATLLVFPLVFAYGMSPAEGPALVFDVLPRVFVEMPAGQAVGTLFFVLLSLAALTPTIAAMEPFVSWLQQRLGRSRASATAIVAASSWVLGLGSVLSFNRWADWRPFAAIPMLADKNLFGSIDFIASNLLMPAGALCTSIFIGWRVAGRAPPEQLGGMSPRAWQAVLWLLRWFCPAAIVAVAAASLA